MISRSKTPPIPPAGFCDQLLHPLALEIFLVSLYLGEELSHIPLGILSRL